MTADERGIDRVGRRAKKMLSAMQKYEIWLQLLRRETSATQAAESWQVDPSTINRIRKVAKEGALEALAESRPGNTRARKVRDAELEALRRENAQLAATLQHMTVKLAMVEGKDAWG
ncbi:hypothetical protein [Nocardiopsis rhodophaea]|uniref:hypothetical protein n=1 Tax=Nocardiopsis rhodophaea TaxID=280238 RepID=UPI0031D654DC